MLCVHLRANRCIPRLFCYICLLSLGPSAHDFSCLAIYGLHVHPYTCVFFFFSVCQWLASICVSVFLVFVLFRFLVSVTYVCFLGLHGVVVFSRPILFELIMLVFSGLFFACIVCVYLRVSTVRVCVYSLACIFVYFYVGIPLCLASIVIFVAGSLAFGATCF